MLEICVPCRFRQHLAPLVLLTLLAAIQLHLVLRIVKRQFHVLLYQSTRFQACREALPLGVQRIVRFSPMVRTMLPSNRAFFRSFESLSFV